MKISDIMTFRPLTIVEDAPLSRALRILAEHRISSLPVVDDANELVGIVTEGDFIRAGLMSELLSMRATDRSMTLASRTAGEIMTHNPTVISPDASVDDAIDLMSRRSLKRLPVTEEGKVVGLISRADLLQCLLE